METSRPRCLPVGIVCVVVVALVMSFTVVFSGSMLGRLADINVNRVLAGTFGEADARVTTLSPLMSEGLAALYRATGAVNWYGVMLLGVLGAAFALIATVAGRRRGGMMPALLMIAPVIVLTTYSLHSTVVAAVAAAAFVFGLCTGNAEKRQGMASAAILLGFFAGMLNGPIAALVMVSSLLLTLPGARNEGRLPGIVKTLPAMIAIFLVLNGASLLIQNTPELKAYRENAARYEKLMQGYFTENVTDYVIETGSATDDGHDHASETAEEHAAHGEIAPPFALTAAGLSDNDGFLVAQRYAGDSVLVAPQTIQTLLDHSDSVSLSMAHLLRSVKATIIKPQYLLLSGLLFAAALGMCVPSHGKGLPTLLAVVGTFAGYLCLQMFNRNEFSYLAPVFLVGIAALLYHFNGADLDAWMHRVFANKILRIALSVVAIGAFAVGATALAYYQRVTPPENRSTYKTNSYQYIMQFIASNPDTLFVGDNPNERVFPDTLAVPAVGADKNLLAGSYDLYSPRQTALLKRFAITNPLKDCLDRKDIGYISISFFDGKSQRLGEAYNVAEWGFDELYTRVGYGEGIYNLKLIQTQ